MSIVLRLLAISALSTGAVLQYAVNDVARPQVCSFELPPTPPPARVAVDVAEMADFLSDLSPDERPNQVADWAMVGTLLEAGSEDSEAAALRYSPLRLPELIEALDFQFGEGRHVILASGKVWLFRPAADPHPIATVGRLADQVRMELGRKPDHFEVFTYAPALAEGFVHVTHAETLSHERAFGEEYGLVAARVTELSQLEAFLGDIDDIVWAAAEGSTMLLEGRRFSDHRTPGLTVDDVAALYQAHVWLEAEGARDPVRMYDSAVDSYNAAVRYSFYQSDAVRKAASLVTRLRELGLARDYGPPNSLDQVRGILERADADVRVVIAREENVPQEPGFSLDPRWEAEEMAAGIRRLLRSPRSAFAEAIRDAQRADGGEETETPRVMSGRRFLTSFRRIARQFANEIGGNVRFTAADALRLIPFRDPPGEVRGQLLSIAGELERDSSRGAVSLDALMERPPASLDGFMLEGLKYLRGRHQIQCARYDGPLQGTRVGMVLFYTDVIAKVWAGTDYARSAPTEEVPGFRSLPRLQPHLPPEFAEEARLLRSTRIWFGVRDDRVSTERGALLLAPIVTRVYTAGSNPLSPGAESQANEGSRLTFGWWDRHYADVADFEPQFHLQNQVMKWSLVTAKMTATGIEAGLQGVPVDHSRTIQSYVASEPDLRYRGPFRFLPVERSPTGTECMERLSSYPFHAYGDTELEHSITGGVSLAGRRALAGISAPRWAGGTLSRLRNGSLQATRGSAIVRPGQGIRLRRGGLDLTGGEVHVARSGAAIEIRVGRERTRVMAHRGPGGPVLTPGRDVGGSSNTQLGATLDRLRSGERPARALEAGGVEPSFGAGLPSGRRGVAELLAAAPDAPLGGADDALAVALGRVRRGGGLPEGLLARVHAAEAPSTGLRTSSSSARSVAEGAALRENLGHQVSVVVNGRRARSSLQVSEVRIVHRTTAIDDLRAGRADLWVEEGPVLQSLDWDLQPGRALSRIADDPRFVLERVPIVESAPFRPDLIADGSRLSVRKSTHSYGALLDGRDAVGRLAYRVRACVDDNSDGKDDHAGSACSPL